MSDELTIRVGNHTWTKSYDEEHYRVWTTPSDKDRYKYDTATPREAEMLDFIVVVQEQTDAG